MSEESALPEMNILTSFIHIFLSRKQVNVSRKSNRKFNRLNTKKPDMTGFTVIH
jgi:hypothetical protein